MPDQSASRLLAFVNRLDVSGADIEEACRRAGKELGEGAGEDVAAGRPYANAEALRQRIGNTRYELLREAADEGWLDAVEGTEERTAGTEPGSVGAATEAPASTEPGEEVEGKAATENDRIRASLTELLTRLKDAIEQKKWDRLAEILPFPSIWVVDHPVPLSEVTTGLGRVLARADDIEWQILRLISADREPDRVRLNLEVRILWSDGETWAGHSVNLKLHAGFERVAETWKFSFCGLSPAAGEPAPEARPSEGYFGAKADRDAYLDAAQYFAAATPYFTRQAEAEGSYFGATAADWGPYFDVSYFGETLPGYFGPPKTEDYFTPREAFGAPSFETAHAIQPARPRRRSRYVMVYMPMLTPRDVVEDLLDKDEEP